MNNNTSHKEQPVDKTSRLVSLAKAKIESIALEAAKDPNYFGRPNVELIIQNGALEAINVNYQRSHK